MKRQFGTIYVLFRGDVGAGRGNTVKRSFDDTVQKIMNYVKLWLSFGSLVHKFYASKYTRIKMSSGEMIMRNTASIFFGLFFLATSAWAVPITDLYNTGVDDTGTVLSIGSMDTHYSVSGLSSEAFVVSPSTAWITAPTGSRWIGPSNGGVTGAVGDYIYKLEFDLTGLDASTASINGSLAHDNPGSVFLNGLDTGISNPNNFLSLFDFTLNSGFVSGLNVLEFKVTNIPNGFPRSNPTGLLVSNLSGTASPITSVSEPGTLALFMFGVMAIGIMRKQSQKPIS